MRVINCHKCGTYLGEIRDAKLAKGIAYTCAKCRAAEKVSSKFDDIFGRDNLNKFRKMTGI